MVGHVTEVAEGVHRLTNGVANSYLTEEAGKLVLVDAGAPKDWALFTQAALGLGKVACDLDAVLLTHAHTDHTGFAEKVRATTGAQVWIHEQDAQMACTGKVGPRDGKTSAYLPHGAFWRTVFCAGYARRHQDHPDPGGLGVRRRRGTGRAGLTAARPGSPVARQGRQHRPRLRRNGVGHIWRSAPG